MLSCSGKKNRTFTTEPKLGQIILLRHSRKGKGPFCNVLSDEGHEYARLIGEKSLRGRIILGVYVSPMMRTTQTAVALLQGAGDCTFAEGPTTLDLLGATMEEWIAHCATNHDTLSDIEAAHPDFVKGAERRILEALRVVKTRAAANEHELVLVVSHSPCTELAIRGLTRSATDPDGILVSPLAECEGAVLRVDANGSVTIENEIRHRA